MTNYTATFADGATLSRNSKKEFTHAFRSTFIVDGNTRSISGFASSELLARKAATVSFNKWFAPRPVQTEIVEL